MGHLLGYLLLILAINLLCALIKPASCGGATTTVRRRLWSDSMFDCYSTTNLVSLRPYLDENEFVKRSGSNCSAGIKKYGAFSNHAEIC